jgi:hypothetical protein
VKFSAPVQTDPGGPPSLLFLGCGVDHKPFIAPMLKKSRAIGVGPFQAFIIIIIIIIIIVSHYSSREHRALTKFRHLTRFLASTLTPFHVLP